MTIDEIVTYVESLGGVLTLRPGPGDGPPEIAWGDAFFYFAPDGVVPRGQPFATIITKDYPGEPSAGLDRPDAFRVNVSVDATTFRERTGRDKREAVSPEVDFTAEDMLMAHPAYSRQGWLAVVNPGPETQGDLRGLLEAAHHRARLHADPRAT